MNILVLTAHPEPRSFNHALGALAADTLERLGHEVRSIDLCAEGFDPVAGREDFAAFPAGEELRLMAAQLASASYGGMSADITRHQEHLLWADAVILQFPFWWGSYPAILKGWIERVLAYGFAYGRKKQLPSKRVLFSVTTGGAGDDAEAREDEESVRGLADDVFGYMGWEVAPPFVSHGPARASDEERQRMLAAYERHLRRWAADAG